MNNGFNYWMVKSAALERQMRMQQLQQQATEVDETFKKVMSANGLDAAKQYRLNDADETVTEEAQVKDAT